VIGLVQVLVAGLVAAAGTTPSSAPPSVAASTTPSASASSIAPSASAALPSPDDLTFTPAWAGLGVTVRFSSRYVPAGSRCSATIGAAAAVSTCSDTNNLLSGTIIVPREPRAGTYPVVVCRARCDVEDERAGKASAVTGLLVVVDPTLDKVDGTFTERQTVHIHGSGFSPGSCALSGFDLHQTACAIDAHGGLSGSLVVGAVATDGSHLILVEATPDDGTLPARSLSTTVSLTAVIVTSVPDTSTSSQPSARASASSTPTPSPGFVRWPPGTGMYLAGGGLAALALATAVATGLVLRPRYDGPATDVVVIKHHGYAATTRPVTSRRARVHHVQLRLRVISTTTTQLPRPEGQP
jgi:hypothetical protein